MAVPPYESNLSPSQSTSLACMRSLCVSDLCSLYTPSLSTVPKKYQEIYKMSLIFFLVIIIKCLYLFFKKDYHSILRNFELLKKKTFHLLVKVKCKVLCWVEIFFFCSTCWVEIFKILNS